MFGYGFFNNFTSIPRALNVCNIFRPYRHSGATAKSSNRVARLAKGLLMIE